MKIALVRCPCIKPDYPPDIGLAYLYSSLANFGHEVFIFDLNIEIFHKVDSEKRQRWLDRDSLTWELDKLGEEIHAEHIDCYAKKILDIKPEVIGFSVWGSNISFSLKIAKKIKELDKNIIIIFGGPECYPLLSGNLLIKLDYIDVVVYGEGELTLKEIVDYVVNDKLPDSCPGAIVKRNGSYFNSGNRQPLEDLDSIPFPDFKGFPLDLYLNKKTLFISSNRGCIRRCAYCEVPGTMPLFRYRSAHSLLEEIKYQMRSHANVKNFEFASPALNANLKELLKLCELIIENKLDIYWMGNAIMRPELDFTVLKKMKEAGCGSLTFGLESGSQKILDKMGKMIKVEDAERILQDCYNLNISTALNFIIGFPGEDDKDFQETMNFIERNREHITRVGSRSICWVKPYTTLFNNPDKFNIVLPSIRDTNVTIRDWFDKGSKENTYEIREKRERQLAQLIKNFRLGMDYDKI